MSSSGEFQLAPVRALNDDFLLGNVRFGLPDYQNKERWNNRIVNNLLYYQTNYFILSFIIFLFVAYLKPLEMVLGGVLIVGLFVGLAYFSNNQGAVASFKKDYPIAVIAIIVTLSTLIMYTLGSILVFVFGIALPLFCSLTHASLRMRNVKNKINQKVESVGLKKTPMGQILKTLGQEY